MMPGKSWKKAKETDSRTQYEDLFRDLTKGIDITELPY